jgi:hypothetical protein
VSETADQFEERDEDVPTEERTDDEDEGERDASDEDES